MRICCYEFVSANSDTLVPFFYLITFTLVNFVYAFDFYSQKQSINFWN
jgi:hypothetical protein